MREFETQDVEWEMYKRNFSMDRLSLFIEQGQGSLTIAMQLYDWNAKVSASLWEVVGYVEIGIRTTIDRQLSNVTENGEWLSNPQIIKPSDSLHALINRAKAQATVRGRVPNHHHVIEQLPLGFLQALLSKKYLNLWPTLASGFIGANRNSHSELSMLVKNLRKLRNRIGHHNHLLDLDLSTEYSNLMRIAELIDPKLRRWVESKSQALLIILEKPR